MGNTLALVKDCKLLLKELPGLLATTMKILIGVTSILEDIEKVIIDVKEIIDLLQIKNSMDEKISVKAKGLLNDAKQKLSNATMNGIQERRGLEEIKTLLSALLELKTRQCADQNSN